MTRREFDEAYDNGYKHGYAAGRSDSDVLDRIRAEIENDWQLRDFPASPFSCGLRHALEIIDKYRKEACDEDIS